MAKIAPILWTMFALALFGELRSGEVQVPQSVKAPSETIPLGTAIGIPEWHWEGIDGGGGIPFTEEDPTATGGAKVILPNRAALSVQVPGEGFIRFRFNGLQPTVEVEGERVDVVLLKDELEVAGSDDQIASVWIPAGGGQLQLSTWWQIELDYVEWIQPPASIAKTLGLPDIITIGGMAEWVPGPAWRLGKYVVELAANEAPQTGWFEFPVTGPAEVAVRGYNLSYHCGIQLLVNGQEVWDIRLHNHYNEFTSIEIPEGTHTVRFNGIKQPSCSDGPQIRDLTITPLSQMGMLATAMDHPTAWGTTRGDWQISNDGAYDGVDSLRPSIPAEPSSPNHETNHILKTAVRGPGYASFMTHLMDTGESSKSSPILWGSGVHRSEFRRLSEEPQGWQQHRLWYPPGDHWIYWVATGTAGELASLALDQYAFLPSETLTFHQVVGNVDGTWKNDPERPWSGVRKDPDGDPFIISPLIGPDEQTGISLVVQGPGSIRFHWANGDKQDTEGTFWINGIEQPTELSHLREGTMVNLEVPYEGDATLEWKFTARFKGNWAAIKDVEWTPRAQVTLREALDTPVEVEWETSSGLPLKGFTDTNAVNGSSAQVGLLPGEETWLEATVNGSGLFDFWFRDVPGALNDPRDLEWELYIDGTKSYFSPNSNTWPAQWVLGSGPHKIRLVFRNNTDVDGPAFIAVDDVSWQSLMPAQAEDGWTASHPELVDGFTNGGLENGPQHVLPLESGEVRWIEKTVTGPGLLEWTTRVIKGRYLSAEIGVWVNGAISLPLGSLLEWESKRLHIPEGVHTVRWISVPNSSSGEGYRVQSDAVWQISNIQFMPGMSALMRGIDDEEMIWFEAGGPGGRIIGSDEAYDNEDAWSLGEDSNLYVLNTGTKGIKAWCMLSRLNERNQVEWAPLFKWVGPGEIVEWVSSRPFSYVNCPLPCNVDQFTMKRIAVTSLEEAVDADEEFVVHGWQGLAESDRAFDGVDVAWSYLSHKYQTGKASMTLEGPAKMRFRWKSEGTGSLGMRVDGAWFPVAVPDGNWQEVEFDVYQPSLVEWIHKPSTKTHHGAPAEAWLDSIVIEDLPARSLGSLAGEDSGLVFTSTTDSEEAYEWRGVAYRDASGDWQEGARAITGATKLQTTVTGPALLSFRSYCKGISIPQPAMDVMAPQSVIIIFPGWSVYTVQRYLSVTIEDSVKLRIIPEQGEGWIEHNVHIPEGEHQVAWQLNGFADITDSENEMEEWQTWVSDVAMQSPQTHYESWTDHYLEGYSARAPEDDADADGVSNFLEYAYGFDPGDKLSKPPAMFGEIRTYREFWEDDFPKTMVALHVPRISAHVTPELQMSNDFETWTPSPIPLRSYSLREGSPGSLIPVPNPDSDNGIYQVMLFEIDPDQPAMFFRVLF